MLNIVHECENNRLLQVDIYRLKKYCKALIKKLRAGIKLA